MKVRRARCSSFERPAQIFAVVRSSAEATAVAAIPGLKPFEFHCALQSGIPSSTVTASGSRRNDSLNGISFLVIARDVGSIQRKHCPGGGTGKSDNAAPRSGHHRGQQRRCQRRQRRESAASVFQTVSEISLHRRNCLSCPRMFGCFASSMTSLDSRGTPVNTGTL